MNGLQLNNKNIRIDSMVHELKNPIAILLANLSWVLNNTKDSGPLTTKQRSRIERALRATKTIGAYVENILEIGRSEEGLITFTEFKLSHLILETIIEVIDFDHSVLRSRKEMEKLEVLKEVAQKKNLDVRISKLLWSMKFESDFSKIKQILANLITNGLKYKNHYVELSITHDDGQLIFVVKDDGEGIPSIYHGKIFERYFRIKNSFESSVKGHGIGLAAVAMLVKDLEGMLSLESSKNKGSIFTTKIPVKQKISSAEEVTN
jgi:signal transduction histidine kinase